MYIPYIFWGHNFGGTPNRLDESFDTSGDELVVTWNKIPFNDVENIFSAENYKAGSRKVSQSFSHLF